MRLLRRQLSTWHTDKWLTSTRRTTSLQCYQRNNGQGVLGTSLYALPARPPHCAIQPGRRAQEKSCRSAQNCGRMKISRIHPRNASGEALPEIQVLSLVLRHNDGRKLCSERRRSLNYDVIPAQTPTVWKKINMRHLLHNFGVPVLFNVINDGRRKRPPRSSCKFVDPLKVCCFRHPQDGNMCTAPTAKVSARLMSLVGVPNCKHKNLGLRIGMNCDDTVQYA